MIRIICPNHGSHDPDYWSPHCYRWPKAWHTMSLRGLEPRPGIHVTDGTSCLRALTLRDHLLGVDTILVDLEKLGARIFGTEFHEMLDRNRSGQRAEERVTIQKIAGLDIEIVGRFDLIEEVREGDKLNVYVSDYKTGQPSVRDRIEPYPDHIWQAQTYRYGLDRMGLESHGWRIWYFIKSESKWYPYSKLAPLPTTYDIAGHESNGMTVAQRWGLHDSARRNGTSWRDMPMEGTSKFFGPKTQCDYCEFKTSCYDGAGIGFSEGTGMTSEVLPPI